MGPTADMGQNRKSAKCHFSILAEQKKKDRLAAVSPSPTSALIKQLA